MSELPPLVTFFFNATAECQIFGGMIDGIKLVRTTSAGVIDIRHGWHDVTFCDCRLGGGAGSMVDDSKVWLMPDHTTSRDLRDNRWF